MSSKENLLYFDYYNINAKEYFRQKYEIINKNNNNNKISEEPKVEESDDEKNSPQNTPSSFDDLSYQKIMKMKKQLVFSMNQNVLKFQLKMMSLTILNHKKKKKLRVFIAQHFLLSQRKGKLR